MLSVFWKNFIFAAHLLVIHWMNVEKTDFGVENAFRVVTFY